MQLVQILNLNITSQLNLTFAILIHFLYHHCHADFTGTECFRNQATTHTLLSEDTVTEFPVKKTDISKLYIQGLRGRELIQFQRRVARRGSRVDLTVNSDELLCCKRFQQKILIGFHILSFILMSIVIMF
jgi:hypothetical protein